ncbi:MAG: response regulator [Acidobacteriota bacterium]
MESPAADRSADRGLVLLVEDDELLQRALLRMLRTTGYRAEAFGSVDEFFDRPPIDEPVCLILDLHLPGGNGLEILDRLAAVGDTPPAVVLTGHGDVPSAVRAMKKGAIEFLEKPFDRETLLAALARGMNEARSDDERARRDRRLEQRLATLTPREREVFEHVVAGWANKRVAGALGITEQTVKVHRGRVMEKMGASSLAHLVRMAVRLAIEVPA